MGVEWNIYKNMAFPCVFCFVSHVGLLLHMLTYDLTHLEHGDGLLAAEYSLELVIGVDVGFFLLVLQAVLRDVGPQFLSQLSAWNRFVANHRAECGIRLYRFHERCVRFAIFSHLAKYSFIFLGKSNFLRKPFRGRECWCSTNIFTHVCYDSRGIFSCPMRICVYAVASCITTICDCKACLRFCYLCVLAPLREIFRILITALAHSRK